MSMTNANALHTPTNAVSLTSIDYGSSIASTTGVFSVWKFAIASLATELTSNGYTP